MELNAKEVLKILREKGINTFYHADTVKTSYSFLQKGKLLSRGELESQGLPMTKQGSDNTDKQFGLWHYIFVDGVDIHDRIEKRNLYGPVLFCIDIAILEQFPTIQVTKSNPTKWNINTPKEERFFQNTSEFMYDYNYGDFSKMFVLPCNIVQFSHYLHQIIIDDNERKTNGTGLCDQAIKVIEASAKEGGLNDIQIKKRNCPSKCTCKEQYHKMRERTILKFYSLHTNN